MRARIQLVEEPGPVEADRGRVAFVAGACAVGLVALLIAAAATRSCSPARAAEPLPGDELLVDLDELEARVHRDAELVRFWQGVAFTDSLARLHFGPSPAPRFRAGSPLPNEPGMTTRARWPRAQSEDGQLSLSEVP